MRSLAVVVSAFVSLLATTLAFKVIWERDLVLKGRYLLIALYLGPFLSNLRAALMKKTQLRSRVFFYSWALILNKVPTDLAETIFSAVYLLLRLITFVVGIAIGLVARIARFVRVVMTLG